MDRPNIRVYVILLCFSLTFLNYAQCSKEDIFAKVVALVSPGEVHLTEKALRSVLTELEKRVQCSDVSCGKVFYSLQLTFTKVEVQKCTSDSTGRYLKYSLLYFVCKTFFF